MPLEDHHEYPNDIYLLSVMHLRPPGFSSYGTVMVTGAHRSTFSQPISACRRSLPPTDTSHLSGVLGFEGEVDLSTCHYSMLRITALVVQPLLS